MIILGNHLSLTPPLPISHLCGNYLLLPISHICEFHIWMASYTSGLAHIKKTMEIYVIDSNNFINIRVSHSGLDHLVTEFVTFLC